MYFNVSRYIFRFVAVMIRTVFGGAWRIITLPFLALAAVSSFAFGTMGWLVFKPSKFLLQQTLFRPAKPKCYVRVGKPIAPNLMVGAANRPALSWSSGQATGWCTTDPTSREELVKRMVVQKQAFVAKFNAQVVSV